MGNYKFNLAEWLPRFPLRDSYGMHYLAVPITSPCHLCNNEHLRAGVAGRSDWGAPVGVDVFVMAEGEPADRHVTKVAGLPYRPRNIRWPRRDDGKPLTFLAQFCFVDSKDLVGDLPGDVLLVFTESEDQCCDTLYYEWYPLGISDLIQPAEFPKQPLYLKPFYGHVCRVASYPEARWTKLEETGTMHMMCDGKEISQGYWLLQYQAMQIGRAPFFIQGNPGLPGKHLCAINSVWPDIHQPYPWINHPEPLYAEDEWHFTFEGQLELGDTGCIYITMTDDGELHSAQDCF